MMSDDITITILTDIRDELTGLRTDFTGLRAEFTALRTDLNARIDETNVRLGRVEQGLIDLGRFTQGLALDMNRYERWHHHHVDRLEVRMEDLTDRVERLEARPAGEPSERS